ncbi:MAG: cell division protein FtsH, partial [Proteobacteria bacterium]|nr:cell division protein FtsH [Pseudomonadota bacterium]
GKKEEQIFLGREIAQHRDYSESTAIRIDDEVKGIVLKANEKVHQLLSDNITVLKSIAEALLERETLGLEDIKAIMARDGEATASAETSAQQ